MKMTMEINYSTQRCQGDGYHLPTKEAIARKIAEKVRFFNDIYVNNYRIYVNECKIIEENDE